jgi:nucleotide-binding universal stress UspA family protein
VVKTTGGRESEKVAGTPDGTFRALAAYDGSDFGEKIASVAGKLSWPDGTRGWALTVVPPMFHHQLPAWMQPIQRDPDVQAMAEAWQKDFNQHLEQSVDELKKFQQTLPSCFHATEPIVAQGHPAEQVLATLTRQKIDLAIVGSRGQGAVERLLVGSTSARVVNEANCSVLVAR